MITAPIPIPKSPTDNFNEGMRDMQSTIDSIRLNQYRMAETARQQKLLPALLQEYSDKHSLNPYEKAKLQAQAQEAQENVAMGRFFRNLINPQGATDNNNSPTPQVQNAIQPTIHGVPNAGNDDAGLINYDAQGHLKPNQGIAPQIAPQEMPPLNAAQAAAPGASMPNAMGTPNQFDPSSMMMMQAMMQNPNMTAANAGMGGMTPAPDQMPIANPNDEAVALPPIAPAAPQQMPDQSQVAPQQTQPAVQPSPAQSGQIQDEKSAPTTWPTKVGEVVEVVPAKKGKEFLDNIPIKSYNKNGFSLDFSPKEKTIGDGILEKTYPSGRVTREKVAPSWEEKQEIADENRAKRLEQKAEIDEKHNEQKQKIKEETDQNKTNITESKTLEDQGQSYEKAANSLVKMDELLDKNPNLTSSMYALPLGIGSGLKRASNSEPLGQFDAFGGDLQAEASRQATGKNAGKASLNWASLIKPDSKNGDQTNRGLIEGNAIKIKKAYETDKARYERLNPGKDYPASLPPKIDQIIERANGKGHVTEENILHTMKVRNMTREQVLDALKKKGLV